MSAAPLSTREAVPNTNGSLSILSIRPALITITPAQLAAGRAAFKRKRRLLDDLWQAFDVDIDAAVKHIYREMVRAGQGS